MKNKTSITNISRKDMGYPVRYSISSDPIPSRDMGESSFNTIPLKRYRDVILMGYLVRRYIYRIVLRSGIFMGYPSDG